MDPFQGKLFEGATIEQRFEISVRALGQAAKVVTLMTVRFSDLLDYLETIARRLEGKSWEQAIKAELKRREQQNASSR